LRAETLRRLGKIKLRRNSSIAYRACARSAGGRDSLKPRLWEKSKVCVGDELSSSSNAEEEK
jgi:hypothetical protein